MRDLRGYLSRRYALAFAGTVAIHIALFGLLLLWAPRILPPPPQQIPIEIIELSSLEEAKPIAEPVTEPPEIVEERIVPEPEPDPEPPEEVAEVEQPPIESRPVVVGDVTSIEEVRPPSSGVSVQVQAPVSLGNDAAKDIVVIDPQYEYKFDPFAETAPTLIARVSRATNCSRVNRDARPAFCPNIDEDDIYLAAIGADRPSVWEQASYDPVQDLANAQSALGRFAARQTRNRPNARSEVAGVDFHPVTIPDEDCVATPFGFGGPDGPNGTITPGIPDSKALHCR